MNSGMGVSEKLSTAALLLRTSWCRPASPPRNSTAPMRLMAMKENATGMPTNSRIVEPPSRSRDAICQDIFSDLRRGTSRSYRVLGSDRRCAEGSLCRRDDLPAGRRHSQNRESALIRAVIAKSKDTVDSRKPGRVRQDLVGDGLRSLRLDESSDECNRVVGECRSAGRILPIATAIT